MGCPVCGKSSSITKALNNSFKKQDIQDLLQRIKEQRRKDIELLKKQNKS